MRRVAIVVSHPIQHFCPQYRSWTALGIAEVKVFFGKDQGVARYFDKGFDRDISWGEGLLAGFESKIVGTNSRHRRLQTFNLFEDLANFDPDVVVVYGYSQRLEQIAMSWCLRHSIPIAYIADSELRHDEPLHRRLAKRVIVSRVLQRMTVILSVGDANEEYYVSMRVDRSRIIRMHFPIDHLEYDQKYAARSTVRHARRSQLGLNDGDVAILMVGKLATNKRQVDLISAVGELAQQVSGVALLLAGSGPLERECATLAAQHGNTRLLGFVDPAELPALYAACDIYAHVSSYDPHPLAVSEAVAMGLPVVCTKAIGSWGRSDDVAPFVNGLVVDVGDVEQLSHSLGLLAASPDLRTAYGDRSRSRSESFQRTAHRSALEQLVGLV